MSHLWVCHDSFMSVPWLILCAHTVLTSMTYIRSATWVIYECTMTHSWECHDSFYARMQYSQVWHTSGVRRESSTRVPWLIRECAMTHSMRVYSTHKRDMGHTSGVRRESSTSVPWLIRECAMTVNTSTTWVIHMWPIHEWAYFSEFLPASKRRLTFENLYFWEL